MKTRPLVIALGFAPLIGAPAAGQQVEYVTRNVQPTHAIRFNAAPIRITLTDRGTRSLPLTSSPKIRPHRPRIFIGGGHRIVIGHPVIRIEQPTIAADPRPRTVYGADRPSRRSEPAGSSATETRRNGEDGGPTPVEAEAAERRRLALQYRAILRAERRAAERSAR